MRPVLVVAVIIGACAWAQSAAYPKGVGGGTRAKDLTSLAVADVPHTTPTLVLRYVAKLNRSGRAAEAAALISALPDDKLTSQQLARKQNEAAWSAVKQARALNNEGRGAEALAMVKALPTARLTPHRQQRVTKSAASSTKLLGQNGESKALEARAQEAFEGEWAALKASSAETKWDAAFDIAVAGKIESAMQFDSVRKRLGATKRREIKEGRDAYPGSYVVGRLNQIVAAVPVDTAWLYEDGHRWKGLLWAKVQAGDETYNDVLVAAGNHDPAYARYGELSVRWRNANTMEDYEALKADAEKALKVMGLLRPDDLEPEYYLFCAVYGMKACMRPCGLSGDETKAKYLEEGKQWAERVKKFGESAFRGEAQKILDQ